MKSLLQPVSIVCDVDPTLTPLGEVHVFHDGLRLRLLPVKGGVCLIRGGVSHAVHETPASLALELLGCAEYCDRRVYRLEALGVDGLNATLTYFEDKREFYRAAARAVETDSRALRMWGLA